MIAKLAAQENFLLLSMLKTAVLLHIFVKNCDTFFKILWWIENSKEQHVFEIEIICKIINVFMVFFVKMNASYLTEVLFI